MISKIKSALCGGELFLLISIVFLGGFHEYISCLLSVGLTVWLSVKLFKKKTIVFKKNLLGIAVFLISLTYGLSCLWAIDPGMGWIGFLKFLPVSLYLLLLWQEDGERVWLKRLPYVAAILTVITSVATQIDFLKEFFTVAGRFAGSFQYPNTFALFLLICELLLLKDFRNKIINYVTVFVLIFGILYTGSRTVFILFFLSNFAMIFFLGNRKWKRSLLIVVAISFLVVGIGVLFLKDTPILDRYLNINFGASTFVGRILYFVDALPLLLKYPFGMGYMGYYYIQNSIQTGIYNVVYVHNDFLQLFLDVGFLPVMLFLGAILSYFFKKNISITQKIIVATFCIHTLFDFNLQFMSMFFLLISLLDVEPGKTVAWKGKWSLISGAAVLLMVNLYMTVPLVLSQIGLYQSASAWYPYDTRNNLQILAAEKDLKKANDLADRILEQNDTYFAPYSMKAKYAYSVGNFAGVIENKNQVFLRTPFRYTEYREYCRMLINGAKQFERQGDLASVQVCNREILSAYEKLQSNRDRLSFLGGKINEQPTFNFAKDISDYIGELRKEQGYED